jgi:hypothetical protein
MSANSFNYVDWLAMESLRLLLNKLQVAQFFNTSYNKEYTKEFAVGETVRVNFPQRFSIREGLAYSPQAINRQNTTVTVDQIFGVDFEWDSAEQALTMERGRDKIEKEYLDPAMAQIAQEIDSRCALWAKNNTPNIVGALGTDPTSFTTFNQARQRMVEYAGWTGAKRGMIIPPAVNTSLVAAAVQYFNPADAISKQYKEGSIGRNSGFDWYESMSLYTHTAGVWQTPASVTIAGSNQTGSSLLLNCTSGDTFIKGDVISIAAVKGVNPMTRRVVGGAATKQFVVTATTTASAATVTVPIYPAITGPGSPYQNVDALPLDTALVTLFPGTTAPSTGPKSGINGLALNQDAFALVGVKLETPKAVEMASQKRDPETGISVRFVRMFDPQQSKMVNRFDVLIGFGNLYADQCAVRVLSA